MNQVPSVSPNQVMPQQQLCPQQPNYNAVKIDIVNPSVNTPGSCQPQYAQPTAPIYNYPQAPVYNYPQSSTVPVMMPPQIPAQPQAQPEPSEVAQQPQAAPQTVINQQNNNAPAVPVNTQQPAAEVPQPEVSQPQAVQPEVAQPEPVKPQVDLNSYVSKLAAPDFQGQLKAMEDIADLVKDHPEQATELVDTKVFNALNDIINIDTSKLEGPSQAQIEARQKIIEQKPVTEEEKNLAMPLTQRELADQNKSYALFTIAILDKLYAGEIEKLSNQKVALTELPSAMTLVDQLKDNPNPMVRSSAIEALSYLQTPEYKKDLTTLFTVAKNDQDPIVVKNAEIALSKLEQV